MKVPALVQGLLSSFALCAAPLAFGQGGMPTSQPKLLTIVREEVKPGKSAEHARHEAGWPAAFEKAKSPDYYIAMTSLTGPTEAWYVVPYASHAAIAETMKREDKDPVLSAELGRLSARDAEFVHRVSVIQAAGRPDLSFGTFPDTAKMRFLEITTFTIRPGKGDQFDAIAKVYATLRKRVAPNSSYRIYSVISGMPGPAYLIFSSVTDYAQFDQEMENHVKTIKAATPQEKAELDKWSEIVVKEESQRFKLDPGQSYVPKETRATDPEFWSPK